VYHAPDDAQVWKVSLLSRNWEPQKISSSWTGPAVGGVEDNEGLDEEMDKQY